MGLISGATVGVLICASVSGDDFFNCSRGYAVGITLLMAGVGGGIGAVVGSAMSGEHWETIPVPEVAHGS